MQLRDVMTPNPTVCRPDATASEAAALMRDQDIGDVLVQDDSGWLGIVTDRDIVTRAVAAGQNPNEVRVGDICTKDAQVVKIDTSVEDVIRLMSEKAIRRVPVCEGTTPVGVVSLGDLAADRDPSSLLGDISSAPPNN